MKIGLAENELLAYFQYGINDLGNCFLRSWGPISFTHFSSPHWHPNWDFNADSDADVDMINRKLALLKDFGPIKFFLFYQQWIVKTFEYFSPPSDPYFATFELHFQDSLLSLLFHRHRYFSLLFILRPLKCTRCRIFTGGHVLASNQ